MNDMPPLPQLEILETKIEKIFKTEINVDLLKKNIRRKVNKEVDQVCSSIVTYAKHKFKLEIS